MRRPIFLGLLCLATAAMPAHSAENLACLTGAVDRKLSAEVFKAYRAEKDIGEALMARMGDKAAACAAANDWSAEALESAFRVLFGQILARGTQAELRSFRIDRNALQVSTEKYLASLSYEKYRQFVDGELSDDAGEDIVKQLVGDEVVRLSQIDEKLGNLIGEYAAGHANEMFFAAEFSRQ